MTMHERVESEHPLFRALVLMGGALALGCGGTAQLQPSEGVAGASGGAVSATAGASSVGGSATDVGGSAGGSIAEAVYNPTCPYAQWSCPPASPFTSTGCYLDLLSKDDPVAAGCTCETARPQSGAACRAGEVFVCRQALPPYAQTLPTPPTWDGTLHVQCACVVAPAPTHENCGGACIDAFSESGATQCRLRDNPTCDDQGVCTATSADVLSQDGVMCGCASVALK